MKLKLCDKAPMIRFDKLERPLLIAEIGNNHEGDAVHAKELIDAAIDSGADIVKFQVINPAALVNISEVSRITQLASFSLPITVYERLSEHTRARGARFSASVFDEKLFHDYLPLLDIIKIASGDLDFYPLISLAASSNKPVLLSTGMANLVEIINSINLFSESMSLESNLKSRLSVLHCVSLYPCPLNCANLNAIGMLKAATGLVTGYSDHTLGIEVAIMALAMGAKIIEKHFTLNKNKSDFRDHALSADPDDLRKISSVIKSLDGIIGDGNRLTVSSDLPTRSSARRSIVARHNLKKGTVLTESDLAFVRPASGISPSQSLGLVGLKLKDDITMHHIFSKLDFE